MSAASSPPRLVGLMPTTAAPDSAAAPIQNRYSGTLSSRTPTWKGPVARRPATIAARAWLSATTSRQV